MGIVSRKVFVDQLVATAPKKTGTTLNPDNGITGLRREIAQAIGASTSPPPAWLRAVDEASAIECYDKIRDYIVRNGYIGGKLLRPWVLDPNLTAALDRNQCWWGWEFETGYQSTADRGTAVAHCWDNYDGVIFDTEGEGNAAVEITFTPQEESKFRDGSAQALRFMNWLSDNKKLTMKTGSTNIGTHLNISHSKMTVNNIANVAQWMNRTVGALEDSIDGVGSVRQAMFGRAHLYGGFYVQNQKSGVWLEGKLFRTTYDAKQFAKYVKSAHALSRCLDALFAVQESKEWEWQFLLKNYPYVANLYEMAAEGAEPVIRWAGANSPSGSHNGGGWMLSSTLKTDKTPQTRADAEAEIKRKEEEERQRKIKEAEAKAAAERELAAEKQRRADYAAGKSPKGLPKDFEWCDDCGDWHNDEFTSEEYFAKAAKKAAA